MESPFYNWSRFREGCLWNEKLVFYQVTLLSFKWKITKLYHHLHPSRLLFMMKVPFVVKSPHVRTKCKTKLKVFVIRLIKIPAKFFCCWFACPPLINFLFKLSSLLNSNDGQFFPLCNGRLIYDTEDCTLQRWSKIEKYLIEQLFREETHAVKNNQ